MTAAVLIPALFFAAVEMGLRLAGTGYPTDFVQPSPVKPDYVQDNYKFAWRFFPRALARSSQPLMLARQKPADTTRVIVFGGSAAMGYPEPAYGLPRVLEALLESKYPQRDFEVINAAVTAVNSHVVLPIVKDCRQLEADAWVVYMGNNEVHGPFGTGTVFGGQDTPLWLIRCGLVLQRTKIGQLLAGQSTGGDADVPKSWGGLTMFLDHQVRHDDPSLERVVEQFGENLSDILDCGVARHTPVVVSTVVSNLRHCGPLASLHDRSITEAQLQRWRQSYDKGRAAQEAGRFEEAVTAYQTAARIDGQFAELQYRFADCLLETGHPEKAREKYTQARDLDTLRFRADAKIYQTILSVASDREQDGIHLIDAAQRFADASPHRTVGDEYLYEHVHFNFSGNYLLATLVAEQLASALNLPAASGDAWPSEEQCARRLGLTAFHRHLMLREMQMMLRSPPFDQQANHASRDAKIAAELARLAAAMTPDAATKAAEQLRQLVAEHPEDTVLRRQFATLLESTGSLDGAIDQFQAITKQLPHHFEGFYRLGALLNRAKQWSEAVTALRQALWLRPDYAQASNSLGICLSHQDRFAESYEQFQRAVQLKPDFAEAYTNWGLVLANQGEEDEAAEKYSSAVRADADYLPAHMKLGSHYFAIKQYDRAVVHYEAVVRLKPIESAAHINLGLLYLKMERHTDAVRQLEKAVELAPASRLARQALAQARRMDGAP